MILVAISMLFTIIALFTPAWQHFNTPDGPSIGIVSHTCGQFNQETCRTYQGYKRPYEKAVLAFVCLAWIFEAFCLLAALFALISPTRFDKAFLSLPLLSLMTTIFLLIAFVVYASKYRSEPTILSPDQGIPLLLGRRELGYSFGLAIVAFILSVFATTVAFIAWALYKRRYSHGATYPAAASHVNVVKTEEVIVTRS
uniref:MARVEL domain-containing protein n=1 Tax=Panagrolaimus davidi TaxID=227884 RepID=A0A914PRB2_9BILA